MAALEEAERSRHEEDAEHNVHAAATAHASENLHSARTCASGHQDEGEDSQVAPPLKRASPDDNVGPPRKRLRGKQASRTDQSFATAGKTGFAEHAQQGSGALPVPDLPETHCFPSFPCIPSASSPHPRALIELELETLSSCLRAEPTLPAGPDNLHAPWAAALREDTAVQLPKKHCAFKG